MALKRETLAAKGAISPALADQRFADFFADVDRAKRAFAAVLLADEGHDAQSVQERIARDSHPDPIVLAMGSGATVALPVPVVIKGPWAKPRIYPDIKDILLNPVAAFDSLKAMGHGLGEKPFCAGIHLSLADIAVGCAVGYLDFRFPQIDWRTPHPNLAKLQEKLMQRQSFIDSLPA